MTGANAVALAVVGGIAIGAVGYIAGTRVDLPAGNRVSVAAADSGAVRVPFTPLPDAAMVLAQLSSDERLAVESVVRDYLLANPEIIRDAINELQRREDEAAKVAQAQTINDNSDRLFSTVGNAVLGNPDGDITLVEFFDYNCTYCRRAHADMKQLIANDPNLRVVLKEFPVLGPGSVEAAKVSIAVLLAAPEKYADFHDALIGETGQVDGEWAIAIAEDMGLDPSVLRARLDSPEVQAEIDQSYMLGGQLNLTGTPSYVTNKEVVIGAVGYDTLRARLDDARSCITTATC